MACPTFLGKFNSKVMGGFRMTQVFTDRIEAWAGVNVQNYQYRNSPVKSYPQYGEEMLNLTERNENTTMANVSSSRLVCVTG